MKNVKNLLMLGVVTVLTVCLAIVYYAWAYSKEYSIDYGGTTRRYRLHLPAKKPSALVVALHGFGDHPRLMELYTGLSHKADLERFAVVYPFGIEGTTEPNKSWNAGSCCGDAWRKKSDDLGYVSFLAAKLAKELGISRDRKFVVGFSNGALLTHRLLTERPGEFAAGGVVAGSIGGKLQMADDSYRVPYTEFPTPIILIHGEDDMAVPFGGGDNEYLGVRGLVSFESFKKSTDFWTTNNRCLKRSEEKRGEEIILTVGDDCFDGSLVWAYSLRKRGHVWPGGAMEWGFWDQKQAFSATDEIWKFFELISPSNASRHQ